MGRAVHSTRRIALSDSRLRPSRQRDHLRVSAPARVAALERFRVLPISLILALLVLWGVGSPASGQGPLDQEGGDPSSDLKNDSGISQMLLDAVGERGGPATRSDATTSGTVTRGSGGDSRSVVAGIGLAGGETSGDVHAPVRFDRHGNVEVYIHLGSTDEASVQQVRDAVERIEIEGLEYGLIQAWVDPDDLAALASLEAVQRITPPDYGYTTAGSEQTEGDAVMRANLVRAFSGLTGEGVRVGVISNGIGDWTASRNSRDLPSSIELWKNQTGLGSEGTATLEVIHDIAPGAELAFRPYGTSLGMVHAILWLANEAFDGEGADVIVDNVRNLQEPYFEDGMVARAAADAVAGGAVYTTGAGNFRQTHYEGEFVDGGEGFHAFDGSSDISLRGGLWARYEVILQWNDPFGASGNDYDLYICPRGLTPTVLNLMNGRCSASSDRQDGDDDPIEVAMVSSGGFVDVFVKKHSGADRRLEITSFAFWPHEHGVPDGSISSQAAVPGVLTAGAVYQDDPGIDDIASYSSQGPSLIYFPTAETRLKPDVVAPVGVATTGPGGRFAYFHGTSAASPHVGGIAALLVEAQRLADPTMTRKEVADAVTQKIRDTAFDLGPPGHDTRFGYGRADALAAVESLDQLSAATFTVNSTGDGADSNIGDGICSAASSTCTLRAAIQEANAVGASIIAFTISGTGTLTIQPASALPPITKPVFIDGFSQSGASATNYRIELDGTNSGTDANGLTLSGAESWVRGLVINRFEGSGIVLQGSGGMQVIEQNRIGTNAAGTSDVGNGKAGILVSGADAVILSENLISGNDGHGIELSGAADDARIDRNVIGSGASGSADLGNTSSGIHVSDGENAAISNNVIVGNDSHGISLSGSGAEEAQIAQNDIGVNESGTSIGNGGSGVHIASGASDNTIERNTIAHNTADGVTIVSSSARSNSVWQNSIHSNGGLGIDLQDDGVTANDVGDADSGPNNLENFPVLSAAVVSSNVARVSYSMNNPTRHATRGYRVDFYASDSCDASGHGEGKRWLGRHDPNPDSAGTLERVATLGHSDAAGTYITATLSRVDDTSEFSACVQTTALSLPGLTLSEDALEVDEGDSAGTTYTVKLASQPSGNTTVDLTADAGVATVSHDSLDFTTSDWNMAQTVTVTAVDDDDPHDEHTSVQHTVTINSNEYVLASVPVEVDDDEFPVMSLTDDGTIVVTDSIEISERATATYDVVLTRQPPANVTIDLRTSSSKLQASSSSLTFTRDNYNTAQQVTLTAQGDSDDRDERATAYFETEIDGSDYVVATVEARIKDTPYLQVSRTSFSLAEGASDTYAITFARAPTRYFHLRFRISGTAAVTVSPDSIYIGSDWATPKVVRVTSVPDDDELDGVAYIGHYPLSGDDFAAVVEVTVTDDNRAPSFEEGTSTTREVAETAGQGDSVGDPVTALDLNTSDTLTYSLEDASGKFSIDSSTGQITVAADGSLDYEAAREHAVEVTVSDRTTDGLTDAITVRVLVSAVDEPPEVRGMESLTVRENATAVATYRASDPERASTMFTWSLAGDDAGAFAVSETGVLTFDPAPDFEAPADSNSDNTYDVTIQATDANAVEAAATTGELAVSVTVQDIDEPPEIGGTDSYTIAEGGSTAVGSYTATDPEGTATTWLSLTGTDARHFTLDEFGALSFVETPDFDRATNGNHGPEYRVTLRASDGGSRIGTLPVTVTLTNVNERPLIEGDEVIEVNEGHTATLDTYSKRDPEGSSSNWGAVGSSVVLSGTNGDAFEFDQTNGRLSFADPPDYEDGGASYEVTLNANDGALSATLDVTVNVANLDERGEVVLGGRRGVINVPLQATLTDPDNVVASTWQWQRSTRRTGGWTDITSTGSSSYTPTAADRSQYLRAAVSYEDGHGTGKSAHAVTEFTTVNERGTNTAPVLPDSVEDISIPESTPGGRNVGSAVRARDGENDPLVYTLSGAPEFVIGRTTGQIQVAAGATFDFEQGQTTYSLTVTADDGFGGTDTVAVTVRITNVNEAPEADDDAPASFDEDTSATLDVLSNDSDAEDETSALTVSLQRRPSNGSATLNAPANPGDRRTITYTPRANYSGSDSFTYRVRDTGNLNSNVATVALTISPVNDAPTFAAATAERSVVASAEEDDNVGAPVTATDIDGDDLTYSLSGTDAFAFAIGRDTGQITVGTGTAFDVAVQDTYNVTVEADDGAGGRASVEVTITATTVPVGPSIFIGGGGGGGGGPTGPTPSEVDFEWTVKHDIEALDAGHDTPSGMWSDGSLLFVAENGEGADDAVYVYDVSSGERAPGREFALAETNRAPRGVWSDRVTIWISDSGQDTLFAHDLGTGERTPERDIELAGRNADARGIWSDGETMWVLDGRRDALFAYELSSGVLLGECALDEANDDPRGLWSDRSTVWVSNHDPKRLFAYRLPTREELDAAAEDKALQRVRDEEFTELSKAGNNSPRGLWSDGNVMYVADANDGRVYSYNMPDALDARLAMLELSRVEFGEFSPLRNNYMSETIPDGNIATLTAMAAQDGASVGIEPADHDGDEANGYQLRLLPGREITITVTSPDGSRERVYRLLLGGEEESGPAGACLSGAVATGFSLVFYGGGSIEELEACAESRHVATLYALEGGAWVPYIIGAPAFVNRAFVGLFAGGVPPGTALVARSAGPPSEDPAPTPLAEVSEECLRAGVVRGFSIVVYRGGSVQELEGCARSAGVTTLYALDRGSWVPYIIGAPGFVNRSFVALFADGLGPGTPLVAKSDGQPAAGPEEGGSGG